MRLCQAHLCTSLALVGVTPPATQQLPRPRPKEARLHHPVSKVLGDVDH
jgi:hypothetical protein